MRDAATILEESEQAKAALSLVAMERKSPSPESLRDIRMIGGFACRLTLGKLVLLEIADSAIFCPRPESEPPPGQDDILEAIYFLADVNLDEAIGIADYEKGRRRAVKKFAHNFVRKGRVCQEFVDWFNDMAKLLRQQEGDREPRRIDWWIDVIDMLASEYHWREQYILWDLSLIRCVRYQEAIAARKSGEPLVDDISDNVINALDVAEKVMKEHGKS